jgi:trk system potassium uptake protein TrkH
MVELDKNDILIIVHTLSNMMRFVGAAMIVPVLVSAFVNEWLYAEVFALLGLSLFVVFTFTQYFIGKKQVRFKHAIISLAVAWILIGIISAIPFLFYGMSPIDSFFESVSGWSGTGLSMIQLPENLPIALNFWRGFIQWMGGFGIVLMALLFYEKPETAMNLFVAEGRTEEFYVNVKKIARTIVVIYFIYTVIGIALFLLSGMTLFDSVIHSFTSIATGGFSTNSVGVGVYGPYAMAITMLLMLLGGISFENHYNLLKGKVGKFFASPELQFFFAVIVGAFVLLAINFYFNKDPSFYDGLFYIISAITGTGATTAVTIETIPSLTVFILILLMVFGACYGSTTGALKIWRILILFKVIRREIHKAFLPQKTIVQLKIGDRIISDDAALKALSYMALYVFFLLSGAVIFMFFGFGSIESIFTVASAQGNVGLSIISGQAWYAMSPFLKLLLSLHMIVGRMEILPFLILVKSLGFGSKI